MNFSKIKTEIKDRGFTFRKVCEELGITEAGLHQMIRKESMQVEILEKIAKVLGVNVGYFFDEPFNESKPISPSSKCDRCEHLEELLTKTESEVETLKKLVAMYEGEAGRRNKQAS